MHYDAFDHLSRKKSPINWIGLYLSHPVQSVTFGPYFRESDLHVLEKDTFSNSIQKRDKPLIDFRVKIREGKKISSDFHQSVVSM